MQLVLVVLTAPLLQGLIKTTKARIQRRRGPHLLQPWRDLLKFLARENVVSDQTSWVVRWAPGVAAGTALLAALMIPTIVRGSALPSLGDAIVLAGLLTLGRFALLLASLDTASNFAGMGASREAAFAAIVEPALIIIVLFAAIPGGSTNLGALIGDGAFSLAHLLALGALLIVAIAETGRIPVDNPDTHLELTMLHEGMLLEYSGRHFGLLLAASQLKQLAILSLMAALFFPWGMAADAGLSMALLVGLVAWLAKLAVLGLVLAAIESGYSKLRIFDAPELIGLASVLGMLAVMAAVVMG